MLFTSEHIGEINQVNFLWWILSHCFSIYCRCLALDIYRAAWRLVNYPPLATSTSVNSCQLQLESTMGGKSVETLGSKIWINSERLTATFPPKQCWFFYFFDCTGHSAFTTLNWGAGGIRELTLKEKKIDLMLKCRKGSFPKSVSTTFVAHCSFLFANHDVWAIMHFSVIPSFQWHRHCFDNYWLRKVASTHTCIWKSWIPIILIVPGYFSGSALLWERSEMTRKEMTRKGRDYSIIIVFSLTIRNIGNDVFMETMSVYQPVFLFSPIM